MASCVCLWPIHLVDQPQRSGLQDDAASGAKQAALGCWCTYRGCNLQPLSSCDPSHLVVQPQFATGGHKVVQHLDEVGNVPAPPDEQDALCLLCQVQLRAGPLLCKQVPQGLIWQTGPQGAITSLLGGRSNMEEAEAVQVCPDAQQFSSAPQAMMLPAAVCKQQLGLRSILDMQEAVWAAGSNGHQQCVQ